MGYVVNFNDNYVNKFINNYNKKHSDNPIDKYISAKVCSSKNSYRTLQFQTKGNLQIDPNVGIIYTDNEYEEKMKNFIDISLTSDDAYSLVLTPEYSVPLSVIKHLLHNSNDINVGTLYCLCCQSVTVRMMETFINEIEDNFDVQIWKKAWEELEHQTLVCGLFYVLKVRFFLDDESYVDKVFVIPQFKTMPMKDTGMEFETATLSCGNVVVEFGKDDEVRFLSIICADVFNYELITEIKRRSKKHKVFLFNPQLNKKPQNDYFRFMRNMLINYTEESSFKILTLNWSNKTQFVNKENLGEKALSASWSALYEKFQMIMMDKYMNILDENAIKGLNVAHDHHLITYFFPSDEHIIDMSIGKFENFFSPEDIQRTVPVKIQRIYLYNSNEKKFSESSQRCKDMIDDFFLEEEEFKNLVDCEKCCGKCSLSKINEFVSSLYYHGSLKNEFEIINDGRITSVTSKHYKSDYSREKIYICKRVLTRMREGLLTKKFVSKNSKFIYRMSEHPAKFNTIFFCDEGEQLCRVIYLKYKTYNDAEKVFNTLSKNFQKYAENFLIYYEDAEGLHLYEKNVNTKIMDKSMMNTKILPGGGLSDR